MAEKVLSNEENLWVLTRRILYLFAKRDRLKLGYSIAVQVVLSTLDVLGVALLGLLGTLAVSGVQSVQPQGRVVKVLEVLHLETLSFQMKVFSLALIASFVLIARTVLSVVVTRRTLYFLSRKGAELSSHLVKKMLNGTSTYIRQHSSQTILFSLTTGMGIVTLGVLGAGISLVADFFLLTFLTLGLIFVDSFVALTSLVFFALIGFFMFKLMSSRAEVVGSRNTHLSIESSEKIIEAVETFRETTVRGRKPFYARKITELRLEASSILAELQFMPNISKYLIEVAVVIGVLGIAGIQFALKDAPHAVATLTIFLAAATRIAPAIMRIQQSGLQVKSSLASASPTLEMIENLSKIALIDMDLKPTDFVHSNFVPEIKLENVSFRYSGDSDFALSEISLKINSGQQIAVVGPSGAGKTTFIDLLLGLLEPSQGTVLISGCPPQQTFKKWPGAIAYVPQEAFILNASIEQNIALSYDAKDFSVNDIRRAAEQAQILNLLGNEQVLAGERGSKLSGGQRQRLGIARALYSNPKLLILDEATSSLDAQTEFEISEAILKLRGSMTVVLIAHRLSTVVNSDLVIYMEAGNIVASGTFQEVRAAVPDFDRNAKLMGL